MKQCMYYQVDPLQIPGLKDEKMGGYPYWPQGRKRLDSNYVLLAQVHYQKGMLQFFINQNNYQDGKVIFHESLTDEGLAGKKFVQCDLDLLQLEHPSKLKSHMQCMDEEESHLFGKPFLWNPLLEDDILLFQLNCLCLGPVCCGSPSSFLFSMKPEDLQKNDFSQVCIHFDSYEAMAKKG